MKTIEIDFDVYKRLTVMRDTEETTYNDVLREMLKIDKDEHASKEKKRSFVSKKVEFFHGTKFRASYKGKYYYGEVIDGALVYNGERHTSPSSAAKAITGNSTNGWDFWECQYPEDDHRNWTPISEYRPNIIG